MSRARARLVALGVALPSMLSSLGCSRCPDSPIEAAVYCSNRCPDSPPVPSSSCPVFGSIACSWGDDPRFACRTTGSCSAGTQAAPLWAISDGGCAPLEGECPSAAPPSDDCTLAQLGLTCVYAGVPYTCSTNCNGAEPNGNDFVYFWCENGISEECPSLVPNWGSPCASEGQNCDYNSCAIGGAVMVCEDGVWQFEPNICPV
jgi:hypothetical protein